MKYRRQGPDEREDQGGWPRAPSISTHRVLLPQASVMWCGGVQYCWHSQLESCIGSALRSDCRREGPLFICYFFSVSVSYSCTSMLLFSLFFHLCLFYLYFNPLLASSFFFIHIILSVPYFKPFLSLVLVHKYFVCCVRPRINTFWWNQQISFNAFYPMTEQDQLPKRDVFFFLPKTRRWKMPNVGSL